MVEILDSFSVTPASNNGTPPYGAPEGMAFQYLNDCLRLLMASDAEIGVRLAALETTEAGLGTMSTQNATAVAITGGTISGATISGTITLQADAVTLAMMAHGTAGGLPIYDATGAPVDIGAGTDGYVLAAGGAGVAAAWEQVGTAGIADDAVTLAKLGGGTAGGVIGYDAAGDPVDVGAGTDGYVLTAGGAGVAPAWEAIPSASAANIWAGAASVFVTPAVIETAAEEVTLTDAATIAVDWSAFENGKVTIAGNRTLGLPTNGEPGTRREIRVIQDGVGGHTLGFASGYKFPGGLAPTASTGIGESDTLMIYCVDASTFNVSYQQNWG